VRDRGREIVFVQEITEFGEFFVRRNASRTAARIAREKLERVGADLKRVRTELTVTARHGQMTAYVHNDSLLAGN
jgi:tRNA(Phe) wybutosine-synthesizing methylase Tyw3